MHQTRDKNLEQVLAGSRDLRKDSKIHNVWVIKEIVSADKEAAYKFVDSLDEVITGEVYLAEQIVNMDDWNRIVLELDASTHAHIHKEAKNMPGFKAFKDRMTLLLHSQAPAVKMFCICTYFCMFCN